MAVWHPTEATDRRLVVSEPVWSTTAIPITKITHSHVHYLLMYPRQRHYSTQPVSCLWRLSAHRTCVWCMYSGRRCMAELCTILGCPACRPRWSSTRLRAFNSPPTSPPLDPCPDSRSVPLVFPVPTKKSYTLYERKRSAYQPVSTTVDIRDVVPVWQYSAKQQFVSRPRSALRTSNQTRDIGGPENSRIGFVGQPPLLSALSSACAEYGICYVQNQTAFHPVSN
ncbi:hypothetical protein C8Q77DRAFT_483305 [Trametes polyzona]|nr:hypothetical protein C8Q77DRAFT_483305 [Trametes polyzona]